MLRGNVYAAAASFEPATQGVYRITSDGTATTAAGHRGDRAPERHHVRPAREPLRGRFQRRRVADPAGRRGRGLERRPVARGRRVGGAGVPIGANGITFRTPNEIVVGNTDLGTLVSIPNLPDGSAGDATVIVEDPAIFGIDGLTVDARGTIYACVIAQSTIVRIGDGRDRDPGRHRRRDHGCVEHRLRPGNERPPQPVRGELRRLLAGAEAVAVPATGRRAGSAAALGRYPGRQSRGNVTIVTRP